MKRAELIKRCLFGLMVVGLMVFGALPALAAQSWCVMENGTVIIDTGGAFYADNYCQLIEQTPSNKHTVQRPLSDFLSVQGTFCFPDGLGGCRIFNPGVPNFVTWRDDARNRKAAVDYAGLVSGFGTVVSGKVSETLQADGRALVKVVFATSNAFTWVVAGNNTATSPVIFGNRIDAVNAGAEPALGDVDFRIDFFNTGMGAPLPDLVELLSFQTGDGIGLRSLTFSSDAIGELRSAFGVADGTPGEATVALVNLTMNGLGPTIPVNNIMVQIAK